MAKNINTGEPRQPLSKDRILETAMQIADCKGVEAISMRVLGRELGVRAMSLYKHVVNKDEVLDGIVDIVLNRIDLPREGTHWRKAMGDRARSARNEFRRHPWIAGLFESRLTGNQQTPVRLNYVNTILGILRQNGFSVQNASRAMLFIDSYLYGFLLQEVNWQLEDSATLHRPVEEIEQALMDKYPYVSEAYIHASTENPGTFIDLDNQFYVGLELLFDALEQLRDSSDAS